jgi:hypothetical protein
VCKPPDAINCKLESPLSTVQITGICRCQWAHVKSRHACISELHVSL